MTNLRNGLDCHVINVRKEVSILHFAQSLIDFFSASVKPDPQFIILYLRGGMLPSDATFLIASRSSAHIKVFFRLGQAHHQ